MTSRRRLRAESELQRTRFGRLRFTLARSTAGQFCCPHEGEDVDEAHNAPVRPARVGALNIF